MLRLWGRFVLIYVLFTESEKQKRRTRDTESLIRLFITEIDHLKMAYIVQYPLICNLEFGINHLM